MLSTVLRKSLILLVASFILNTGSGAAANLAGQLPDMGDAGASIISAREEEQLGREFMYSVRQNLTLIEDPLATTYLQDMADRLISQITPPGQKITAFIVEDPSINAFAGPGGYIGVHTGLILAARSESELASVMAHEIAHVTQRHLVRSFEHSSQMSLPTMGAILAAIILGGSNPEITEAVVTSTVAGSMQQQLTFSRAHEQEADRIGMASLAGAGFDPRAMPAFFEVLQEKHKLTESSAPDFLMTHPITLDRIADTRNRAQQYPQTKLAENGNFRLIQARIASLTKSPLPSPQAGVTMTNIKEEDAAALYYKTLQAAAVGDYSSARKTIKSLLESDNNRLLYHYTAGQIELADGQPKQAEATITKTLGLFPGNPLMSALLAEALIQQKQYQEAFNQLQPVLRQYPGSLFLYPLYAKTASAAGENAEAYRALAEYQYLLGNLQQAIDYLNHALTAKIIPYYERLSLEARLKELTEEFAALTPQKAADKSAP